MKSECRCRGKVGRQVRIEIKNKRMRETENEGAGEADTESQEKMGERKSMRGGPGLPPSPVLGVLERSKAHMGARTQ